MNASAVKRTIADDVALGNLPRLATAKTTTTKTMMTKVMMLMMRTWEILSSMWLMIAKT